MPRSSRAGLVAALAFCSAASAQGAVVGFGATVVNSCVLTISTPGALAMSPTGTVLDSNQNGGVNASLAVVSTGNTPTLTFAAPTLTGPSASTASATKEIAFTSSGGASQPYVSTLVNYVLSRLTDTFTVQGRVTNSGGFVSGAYALSTVVTCQQ